MVSFIDGFAHSRWKSFIMQEQRGDSTHELAASGCRYPLKFLSNEASLFLFPEVLEDWPSLRRNSWLGGHVGRWLMLIILFLVKWLQFGNVMVMELSVG
jgi:hypothetical protein